MPLLLLSLSLPDPIIRSNVIETLISAIKSEEGQEPGEGGGGVIQRIISEHASGLVNTMLKNARLTTEEGSHPVRTFLLFVPRKSDLTKCGTFKGRSNGVVEIVGLFTRCHRVLGVTSFERECYSTVRYAPRCLRFFSLLGGNIRMSTGNGLDDPKRSVRKEAVDARTKWFEMNG